MTTDPATQALIDAAIAADRLCRAVGPPARDHGCGREERHLSEHAWNALPPFPIATPAAVDKWLMTFERIMRSSRLAPESWVYQLGICPKTPARVQRVAADAGDAYTDVRLAILDAFGVPCRVGYHTHMIHTLQATPGMTKTEIFEQLVEQSELRDRAAADRGLPPMEPCDLIHGFIAAFGPEAAGLLEQQIPAAMCQPDPLRQMFHIAPAAVKTSSPLAVLDEGPPEHDFAAIQGQRALRPYHQLPVGQHPNGRQCRNCGGPQCPGAQRCPAYDVVCYKCQRPGHFGRHCRRPSGVRGRAEPYDERPPNRRREGLAGDTTPVTNNGRQAADLPPFYRSPVPPTRG
jgi:hypothetical protein